MGRLTDEVVIYHECAELVQRGVVEGGGGSVVLQVTVHGSEDLQQSASGELGCICSGMHRIYMSSIMSLSLGIWARSLRLYIQIYKSQV